MKVIYELAFFLFLLRAYGINIKENKPRKETNPTLIENFVLQPSIKNIKYKYLNRARGRFIYYYINKRKASTNKEEQKGEETEKKRTPIPNNTLLQQLLQWNSINTNKNNNIIDNNEGTTKKRIHEIKNKKSFLHPFKNVDKLSYIRVNNGTRFLKNENIWGYNSAIKDRRNTHLNDVHRREVHRINNIKKDSLVLKAENNNQIVLTEKPIVEKVAKNVKGRLNEWLQEFDEENTLGFFPILLEEMSNEPAPLQIGFEDYLQFNGENVEEIFKGVTRDVIINNEKKKIFGMCFFNHKTGILAPLAVYAEVKDVTKIGNNLAVKGLVRGRIIIDSIIKQEPFILAKISEIEDKKGLLDEGQSLKIVDEIIRTHAQCTTMESELMEQMDQSFASMNIKLRNDLKESIDAKLEKFQIDITNPEHRQAFIQMVSFCAFDFHLMIVDRYDALMLQNSEDRLRFVRDKIRQKQKQLAIIKNTPKEKLQQILEQVQNLKNQANIPNIPNNPGNIPKL